MQNLSGGLFTYGTDLIVPQGVDGVQLGRLVGGQVAEQNADVLTLTPKLTAMSERVGTALKVMPFMELDMMAPTAMVAALASSKPNTMPSTSAHGGGGARFNDELAPDVLLLGAQRFSDADLPCPLRDGHQHDVHNADAAHQQGNGGDGHQHDHHGYSSWCSWQSIISAEVMTM